MASVQQVHVQLLALQVQSYASFVSYLLTGNLDDLQEAVRCGRECLDKLPPDTLPGVVLMCQCTLARSLVRRFLHTRQEEDLDKAIELFGNALPLMRDVEHPTRRKCINYLIFSYLLRENKLEGSIELDDLRMCLSSTSKGTITLPFELGEVVSENFLSENLSTDISDLHGSNLSRSEVRIKTEKLFPKSEEDEEVFQYFLSKSGKSGKSESPSLQIVDSKVHLHRQALRVLSPPPSDPRKISTILSLLGCLLQTRYELQNVREDNDEAIDCFCMALELSIDTKIKVECHSLACVALIDRFRALGRREDLDNGVNHAEQAIANCDSQDGRLSAQVDVMAYAMRVRYLATGNVNDLNTAIQTSLRAVDIAEGNDNDRNDLPRLLSRLADGLTERFFLSGQSDDLRHAVDIRQRAVDSCSCGDPKQMHLLVELSSVETLLGATQLDEEYAEQGVKHLQKAWSCDTQDLAFGIGFNFDLHMATGTQLVSMGRWDETIEMMRMLIRGSTHNGDAGKIFGVLCLCLLEKWEATQNKESLNEAIVMAYRWSELHQLSSNAELAAWSLLGKGLYYRFKITRIEEDAKNALAVLLKGFHMSTCAPLDRILAGRTAINILCDLAEWDRAHDLSQKIVNLMVIVSGRFLDPTDKQSRLHLVLDQIPTYASIALKAGRSVLDVIDLLETCRGSILGQMIDNRTELDDLKRVAPNLAERFAALRDEVNCENNLSENINARVGQISRRGTAEVEIRACLEEIRNVQGFHRFLLGPTEGELKAAASQGPILIVNISSIRSDAIIITENASVLLPLPELTYEEATEYQEEGHMDFSNFAEIRRKNMKYRKLLEWLWDKCVEPIFQTLDNLAPGTPKFHVWWMGIGIASSLPFHAARVYTRKVRESALSKAISSYTPTLKFLMYGRRKQGRKLKNDHPDPGMQRVPSKPEMLIVTMTSTPGQSDLEGVLKEAEKVQKVVRGSYSAQHSVQPNAKEVKEHMKTCEIVHFACHGQSILWKPLSSHLLLQAARLDSATPAVDELTVRDVAALNLSQGKLAFLSACSTAENRYKRYSDEALHLVAGFQAAGFLHGVGNLWPSDDAASVQIVERFYHHLTEAGELGNGENVAKALNEALTDVGEKIAKQPLAWAQFVHFGV